jgi:hypothetical protein
MGMPSGDNPAGAVDCAPSIRIGELVERPIIYGICHLRRREGAGGMSRPAALPRPAGRGAN